MIVAVLTTAVMRASLAGGTLRRRLAVSMIEQLQAAAEALGQGDPGPFASLIADGAEWRGVSRGRLWWKGTPS